MWKELTWLLHSKTVRNFIISSSAALINLASSDKETRHGRMMHSHTSVCVCVCVLEKKFSHVHFLLFVSTRAGNFDQEMNVPNFLTGGRGKLALPNLH